NTPINRAYARCTLMAAVARVFSPGCKKDEMLVLIGPQGGGKSTAIRELAGPEGFTDAVKAGMESKVVIELTEGKRIFENSELEGMGFRTSSAIKAMLSTSSDSSRMAYARTTTDRPRQFVFVGTTNEDRFLRDPTGNRRFWPVQVGRIDLFALRRDRDQLW